uniref:BZIP domain-containing protein n=1 Tax=Panthera leo TaxID=9689 RepID=A0A8C8XKB4_PANLE
MTNSVSTQQGTILQHAQTSDGQQILVPSNQVVVQTASGDMRTYQICTTPSAISLSMKNREAAQECLIKKKEYVKCLENRVAVLENQNKTLIEELKTLKDLYSHKGI